MRLSCGEVTERSISSRTQSSGGLIRWRGHQWKQRTRSLSLTGREFLTILMQRCSTQTVLRTFSKTIRTTGSTIEHLRSMPQIRHSRGPRWVIFCANFAFGKQVFNWIFFPLQAHWWFGCKNVPQTFNLGNVVEEKQNGDYIDDLILDAGGMWNRPKTGLITDPD